MSWSDDLAAWWLGEVASDPTYQRQVIPLAMRLLEPEAGLTYLDLGCGDGPLMAALSARGANPIGVDGSELLATKALPHGGVIVGRLPAMGFIATDSVDGVAVVLVAEHLSDIAGLFSESARVTRPHGSMVMVTNHPLLTAPGSGPFVDPDDGEVLWRWGGYLSGGFTDEPVGEGTARFHHHRLDAILNGAARSGWVLTDALEDGYDTTAGTDRLLAAQSQVPRLLGLRWTLGTAEHRAAD